MKRITVRSVGASLALLCASSVAACYTWDPPIVPPEDADPAGQAGPGGAAASSGDEDVGAGSATAASSSAEASSAQASSTSASVSTTGAATTGGGPGGGLCDGAGNCDDCIACAVQGACEALAEACEQDLGCVAFLDCISGCADDFCVQDCADGNEDGAQLFQDAATCVICDQCSLDCADLTDITGCL